MGITDRDRNRLAALILLIRPAHSLASRVDKLEPSERVQYENYSERMKAFIARNDIDEDGNSGNAWAMVLRGYGPHLSGSIAEVLHGPKRTISISATDGEAQLIYFKECER